VHAEYVAETARQLVFAQYGEEAYTRGLNVHLTVKAADQMVAYRALRKGLMDYELRQVYRGPEAYVDLPADAALIDARVAEALAEHPDNDDLRAAVVLEVAPRKVVAMLQSGDSITVTGDGLRPVTSGLSDKAGPKVQIRRGAVVRAALRNAKGEWALTQVPEVEGALVAMDPRNGAIRAWWAASTLPRASSTTSRRPGASRARASSPSSTRRRWSRVSRRPRWSTTRRLFFDAGDGQPALGAQELRRQVRRPMPLQTALAKSKNMVSIRVLQSTGVDLRRAGWRTSVSTATNTRPT
jgi:penicillin-binding protein 1A